MPDGPPRLCLRAHPDKPLLMRVGAAQVVPGECLAAPDEGRGGSLEVHIEDGRDGKVMQGRVAVRRGQTTEVSIDDEEGSLSFKRRRCHQRPEDSPFTGDP